MGQKVAELLGDEETAFSNYPETGLRVGTLRLGSAGRRLGTWTSEVWGSLTVRRACGPSQTLGSEGDGGRRAESLV